MPICRQGRQNYRHQWHGVHGLGFIRAVRVADPPWREIRGQILLRVRSRFWAMRTRRERNN